MSSPSNVEPGTAPIVRATRPFYWSVRRELWEHRAVYVAPLVVAGVVLFGNLFSLRHLPQNVTLAMAMPPMKQMAVLGQPFAIAAAGIILCGLIVTAFYCLGALNNERRDRSILFWKSLPVSDLTAVLAKAAIPLVVVPLVLFTVVVATQLIMLLLGSMVLLAQGVSAAPIWSNWPILKMSVGLIYSLAIVTLWYAPLYGWLFLVSVWARRVPILWAVLPPLGLCLVEKLALDTNYVWMLLVYRFKGFIVEGFTVPAKGQSVIDQLELLTPGRFLSSPGLWLGLVIATGFLAATVWLRRYREPG